MTATVINADASDATTLKTALETLAPAATDKFGYVVLTGGRLVLFKVTV